MTETTQVGKQCGECTMCCKLVTVPELHKPINTWCDHCDKGKGCKIYHVRPQSCMDFRCVWLSGAFPEEMRPDRSRIVIERMPGGKTYLFLQDPRYPDAWKAKIAQRAIHALVMAGRSVVVNTKPETVITNGRSKESVLDEIRQVKILYGVA